MFEIKKFYQQRFAKGIIIATEDIDTSQWSMVSKWMYIDSDRKEYEIFLPNGFFYCRNKDFYEVNILMPYLDDDNEAAKTVLHDCVDMGSLYSRMLRYCRWLYPLDRIVEEDIEKGILPKELLNNARDLETEYKLQKEINKYIMNKFETDKYEKSEFNDRWFRDDFDKLLGYIYGQEILSPENRFLKCSVEEKIDFLRLFILYRISKLTVKGRSITDLKLYGYQGQEKAGFVKNDSIYGRAINIDDMIWDIKKGVLGGTDGALLSPNGRIKQQLYTRLWSAKMLKSEEYDFIFKFIGLVSRTYSTLIADDNTHKFLYSYINTGLKNNMSSLSLFGYMIIRMFLMDKIALWNKINVAVQWVKDNKDKNINVNELSVHRVKELLSKVDVKDKLDFLKLFDRCDKRLKVKEQDEVLGVIFPNAKTTERGNLKKNLKNNIDKIDSLYGYQRWRNLSPNISTAYMLVMISYLFFELKSSELPKVVGNNYYKNTDDENFFQTGTQKLNRILSVATAQNRSADEWFDYVIYEIVINAIMHPFIKAYCYQLPEESVCLEKELDLLLNGSKKNAQELLDLMIYREFTSI